MCLFYILERRENKASQRAVVREGGYEDDEQLPGAPGDNPR